MIYTVFFVKGGFILKNKFIKDDAYKNLDIINSWISNSDTKASIILGLVGVVITIIFSNGSFINTMDELTKNVFSNMNFSDVLYFAFTLASLSLFTFGIYRLVRVLIPVLKTNSSFKKSYIYFGYISNHPSFSDFKADINNATEEELQNDILNQIYINSCICKNKFSNFIYGLRYFIIGLILLIIMLIIGVNVYL
jgi:hypothetical protein